MEQYIKDYNTYNKIIVYDFNVGSGGIADCIKFFVMVLNICIENNIRLYYKINNIILEKYLKCLHPMMYIQNSQLQKINIIHNFNQILSIQSDVYNVIQPFACYAEFNDNIFNKLPIKDIFTFNITNIPTLPDSYIGIHVRLGDMFLETERSFIQCPTDRRIYDEQRIISCIKEYSNEPILFVCDNNAYRQKIKSQYPNIIITDCDIGHTSLANVTEKQTHDAIVEFYLLSKSRIVFAGSKSGFSIVAAKYNNVPLINLYD